MTVGVSDDAPFVPPDTETALGRLNMAMDDAMRTQRAVRRLHPDPVAHDILLPLLELSLKAPTSSNTQDWSYMVVEDRDQKAALGKIYRRLYRVFNPIVQRQARGDDKALRQMRPGQWQAENFADIPVFVIPCYRRSMKHRPVGRPQIAVSSFYGSVYPANPVCIIPIGWAKGRYGPTTRRPIGEVVHLDRYGNRTFLEGTTP